VDLDGIEAQSLGLLSSFIVLTLLVGFPDMTYSVFGVTLNLTLLLLLDTVSISCKSFHGSVVDDSHYVFTLMCLRWLHM